ncbi:hypothetical protein [Treponema socranskii]|uniref:hypothetical protein n=1 Tax=Treponema socranskii TaxID=53419 RepID=UPI003D6DC33D
MVTAYSLEFDLKKEDSYFKKGQKLYESMKKKIDTNLGNFSINGKLDATKLTENWFPQIDADIFISHSHKDFDSALTLAGFLYKKLDLICFIDSCVWGYSDKLLKAIDVKYCKNINENTYDYDLRNLSTSHVHMMLTVALTKIIYRTESLFFLNTPNSILPKDSIKNKTLSPWIYTELSMIKFIEKKSVKAHRQIIENFSKSMDSFDVEYEVDSLNDLQTLSFEEIKQWGNSIFNNKYEALDYLYKNLGSNNKRGLIYG